MKKLSIVTSGIVSLVAISVIATPVYAWHPKGTIIKEVQNQTAGTAKSDANDTATAVSAAPGDTLVYTITVRNDGAASKDGNNDMAHTILTDSLPTGVELASDPSLRNISEDLGTIKPGKNVTKTYTVKVTSTANNDVITNEACFTGDSLANDNPQHGCDKAIVTVKTPPVPTTTPLPPVLPNTGSTGATAALVTLGALVAGYGLSILRIKRRG